MSPEADGFGGVSPDPSRFDVDPEAVKRLARCGPDPKWDSWMEAALSEARRLVTPRARWRRLASDDVTRIFSQPTPVAGIARRGECWAFVATLGSDLERRVRELFEAGRYVEGMFLDATGSSGVERLCDLAERRCGGGGSTARFSPGYCGWILPDQSRLLDLLSPAEIGIELLPSMIMRPLKTTSGIVVRAREEELQIPAGACAQCDALGCTRRRRRSEP